MKAQGLLHRSMIGYVFTILLISLLAGCGGSGTDGGPTNPNPGIPVIDNSPTSLKVSADTGDFVAVRVNQSVLLDGSRSSTDSTFPLTYAWSFTSIPDGSNAVLQNADSATPGFTPDLPGTYFVQLVVSAGGVESQRAIAAVEVTTGGQFTGWHVHTNYNTFRCADCHDGQITRPGSSQPIQRKSGDHLATSNVCEACHTTFGFELIRYVDHLDVFGNCSSCHNNIQAIGKSEFHVETTAECDECHTTNSFFELDLNGHLDANGKYDHTGITSGCARCHNGVTAIGKTDIAIHNSTTSDCSSCHTVATFVGGFPDHTGPSVVGQRCDSCHDNNGSIAAGEPVGHPVMNVDCADCHNISGFNMGGAFHHRIDASIQACESCHNDSATLNAPAKSSAVPTHVATTDDCGSCHDTTAFSPAFGFDHTGRVNNCAACHGDTGTTTETPVGRQKHPDHFPTTQDCSVCHTPGTFITGFLDHTGPEVTGGSRCDSCHNDVISVGKLSNHIPTTADCSACHDTVDFAGATFDHGSTNTSNCLSCHDGKISKGKSTGHVNTSANCSTCHLVAGNNYTTFAGTFDHNPSVVNNNCASCHDTGIAMPKKVDHIPAQAECSQCHTATTTGAFADNSLFLSGVHSGIVTGCEGCHTTRFIPANPNAVKSASHLPTQQDCDVCHNNNTSFAATNFTHAGITRNCESCHNGNFVSPAGALGKANDPTPPHPDTTQDCNVCHAIGNNFQDGTFDHTGIVDNCAACHGDTTTSTPVGPKKNVGHVQTTQDCSVCHVPGTFANAVFSHDGIVDNCASCHAGSSPVGTIKSGTHLPTTEDCSVCHNTTAFAGARFDHTGVTNNCAVCHDGVTTIGKDGSHVPTNQDCSVCHQTTGFIPGTFDHVGIVNNCVSCHNGTFAQDKKTGHVSTNQDCGVCHTTRGFIPATFDHSSVTSSTRCDSCHGVTATGKDAKTNPAHLATNLDCRSCHTTSTFKGGTWVHDSSTAHVCDTCHFKPNGFATPKSNGHLSTTEQCDVCHTTNGWAPTNFKHSAGGNYPGDHRRDPGCNGCHTGSIGGGLTSGNYPNQLQYAPFCAGCHAGNFKRKGDHIGGSNGTVAQNKDCSGGGRGCHKVTSSGF